MSHVIFVGAHVERLLALSLRAGARAYDVTIVRSEEPVGDAQGQPSSPDAMLLSLTGRENVVDVRELLDNRPGTRFLFLTPDHPPSAALARVVRTHGSVILPQDESDVVIVATLVALTTEQRDAGARRA